MVKYVAVTYVDESGKLHVGTDKSSVMVPGAEMLPVVAESFEPSVIAYTAGLETMWQLGADGTWKEIET